MYSVLDYGRMAGDGVRIDAYARAIAAAVKPGSVVVDLGAGTGVLSLLAARAGAKQVYAVDVNPAVLLLSELAAENGYRDRIQVHHGSSLELTLREPADVIVSDLRGNTPLNGDHLDIIRDARRRLLKPAGAMIPEADELFVQLVETPALATRIEQGWKSLERLGFEASALRRSVQNAAYDDRAASLQASDTLTPPASWAKIDYARFDGDVLEGSVDVPILRRGTAHGLVIWFQAKVHADIEYSSAPGWSLAYARMFAPLEDAVDVRAGERAHVTIRADGRGDRWAWDTTFVGADGAPTSVQRQTTFFGIPTAPGELLRLARAHAPELAPRGQRLSALLAAMNGTRTIDELAADLEKALGTESRGHEAALREVRDAVRDYAR